ncbi:MAG: hypothetical protein HY343_05840, partial [Lentisphaerae bacterium]|nr:hypothetical protein [Lentisphaerota bacterium]
MKKKSNLLATGFLIVLSVMLFRPAEVRGEGAIESGQWFSDIFWPWFGSSVNDTYYFYAESNDTTFLRVSQNVGVWNNERTPDTTVFLPPIGNTNILTNVIGQAWPTDIVFTNMPIRGWYTVVAGARTGVVWNITNFYDYSISFLRITDYPLSYADLNVGSMEYGNPHEGTISVSADLDAGFFFVTNDCTVIVRMGQRETHLVPNIRLYDPRGQQIAIDFPPEYRSEITARLTTTGIYSVVCSDNFIANGDYSLNMVLVPNQTLSVSEPEFGWIINGETLQGTISAPGDMDVAYFALVTGDVYRISMKETDVDINPRMNLYDPAGFLLVQGADTYQSEVVITNVCTTNGVYYVVCKDSQDRFDVEYALSFQITEGPSAASLASAPQGLTATDGTYTNNIRVNWIAPTNGATAYDVWRSYGTNDFVGIATNFADTNYDDVTVSTNVLYYYKVKARNSYGTSTNFSNTDVGYAGTLSVANTRRAILVGINTYASDLGASTLQFCIADAVGVRDDILLADGSNRWPSANVQLWTDNQATKTIVRGDFQSLAATSVVGDVVLYFQSSHGGQVSGTDAFIVLYDALYQDYEMAADLALFQSGVKVIVIIDACNSGGMYQFRGVPWKFAENVMNHYREIKLADYRARGLAAPRTLGDNIAFMTAADYDELSWETYPHGLYSGGLIEAATNAVSDVNSNANVEFMELHNYAFARVQAQEPTQTPQTYNTNLLASVAARTTGSGAGGGAVGDPIAPECDFDGDNISEIAVYDTLTGGWYAFSPLYGIEIYGLQWGGAGFLPVCGDFDGDGTTDLAAYHSDSGTWYAYSIRYGIMAWGVQWGGPSMMPVVADYNGDGASDLAVYEKTSGYWFVRTTTGTILVWGQSWGGTGLTPVPGDYDGDRVADHALLSDGGYWFIHPVNPNTNAIAWGTPWGQAGDLPVAGDFDRDGVYDLAVYRPGTGTWYVASIEDSSTVLQGTRWGGSDMQPISGDYDGDG